MTSSRSVQSGDAPPAVPSTIDEVTPQWLTQALRCDPAMPDDVLISDVRVEQIALDSGFSSRLYRAELSGTGMPDSVIVKLPADSEAGGAMRMLGGYAREFAFYRTVAGHAPIGTPHAYVTGMNTDSGDFILVLEDLRDWHNVDHLAGLTVRRAEVCIDTLAALHAWSFDPRHSPALKDFPGFDTPFTRDLLPAAFAPAWQIYREKAQLPIPAAVDEFAERFAELALLAIEALDERSMLVHGDIRADNMFFRGDELKIVDFQLAGRGCGATDIGYLVSQGLPTELRAGRDQELVRRYVSALADRGVADYRFDEAWRHYRFAAAYFIVLPAMPLLGWDTLPERSRRLCLRLIERAVATIDEIDALEVFA